VGTYEPTKLNKAIGGTKMGMYDWVYVEHNLPDRKVEGRAEFQTKSPKMPNLCSEFVITEDGRLLERGSIYNFSGGFEIHNESETYFCTFREGELQDIIKYKEPE